MNDLERAYESERAFNLERQPKTRQGGSASVKALSEREQIEKELAEVSLLQIGFRTSGSHVTVRAEEKEHLAKWKRDLQARRRRLLTAEEIAAEDAMPF